MIVDAQLIHSIYLSPHLTLGGKYWLIARGKKVMIRMTHRGNTYSTW